MKSQKEGIGERFQQETKYHPGKLNGAGIDWSKKPSTFKDHASSLAIFPLPEPDITGDPNLWRLLYSRRSRREFDPQKELSARRLATLLWATQGVTARYGELLLRTAPSAGGLYPIETYIFLRRVERFEPGIYHLRPQGFDLELLKRGDISRELVEASLSQQMVARAQVTFIWTAVVARSRWKYRERAYRYIYLDAGHIGENLYLAAGAMGLGCCAIGAFFDDLVNELIGVDGKEETAVYMAAVGWLWPQREVKEV